VNRPLFSMFSRKSGRIWLFEKKLPKLEKYKMKDLTIIEKNKQFLS
jgi:hypothetical protein